MMNQIINKTRNNSLKKEKLLWQTYQWGDSLETADTQIVNKILEGTYDATTQIAEVTRFLQSCKKNHIVQTYVHQISPQMFKEAIGCLSEKKSSSTSGIHIGHYKAATNCPTIMVVHCRIMTIPLMYGFAPEIWARVTDIMLEKDLGTPRVYRLRVIQLKVADLNQSLLLQCTKLMVQPAEAHELLQKHNGSQEIKTAHQQYCTKYSAYSIHKLLTVPLLVEKTMSRLL